MSDLRFTNHIVLFLFVFFFFFQAEDGIRDGRVTGVQTCALPICLSLIWMPETFVGMALNSPRISWGASGLGSNVSIWLGPPPIQRRMTDVSFLRSEERRVGKECIFGWVRGQLRKKK